DMRKVDVGQACGFYTVNFGGGSQKLDVNAPAFGKVDLVNPQDIDLSNLVLRGAQMSFGRINYAIATNSDQVSVIGKCNPMFVGRQGGFNGLRSALDVSQSIDSDIAFNTSATDVVNCWAISGAGADGH